MNISAPNKSTGKIAELRIFLLAGLCGFLMLHWPMFKSSFAMLHGDLGDARFVSLCLEYIHQSLIQGELFNIWNAPWLHPLKNTLAYSDSMIGAYPLYFPFRVLGLSPLSSFQGWFLSCTLLNYLCCFLFLRQLRFSVLASTAGAYLFAFSLARASFLNHAQLMPHFFTPLTFLFLAKYFQTTLKPTRILYISLAFLFAVWQLWAGIYLGWFLALGIFFLVISSYIYKVSRFMIVLKCKDDFKILLALFVIALILISPLGYHHWLAREFLGPRAWSDIQHGLFGIGSFFISFPGSYLYGLFDNTLAKKIGGAAASHEKRIFCGFLVFIAPFFIYYIMRKLRRPFNNKVLKHHIQLSLFTLGFLVLFTLHFGKGISLYHVIYYLFPATDSIRAVSRIFLLYLFPLSIILAGVITYFGQSNELKFRRLGLFLLLILIVENSHSNPFYFAKAEHQQRIAQLGKKLSLTQSEKCTAFYYHKKDAKPYYVHIDAMWVSLISQTPTLNGGIGNEPKDWRLWDTTSVTKEQINRWYPATDVCMIN